ncbi:MAG: hypothetical protein QM698_02575 [Micropepsaceae bacterium]
MTRVQDSIDIRADLAGAHSQLIDMIGVFTVLARKRLTATPPPAQWNAAPPPPPRSLDLPDYLARLAAAAMRDVARVATSIVVHADASMRLHDGAAAPVAFNRRMKAAAEALDRQAAAAAARQTEPDRPDFVAFERAVLTRLAEAGLTLNSDDLDDGNQPPPSGHPL